MNWEGQWGSEADCATQGSSVGKQSLKPLIENTPGGWGSNKRNSQPHRRVHWRHPQGPRACTSPSTGESAPEGPDLIVGSGGSDWKPAGSGESTIAPSRPLPHIQHDSPATSVTLPRWTTKAPPLYVTGMPRQKKKKMAQMKEQIKAPEKIQLSDEEIANLSDS